MQRVHAGIRHRKFGCNSLDKNTKKVKKVRMNQDFKKKQTKTRVEKRQKLILNQARGRGVCVDYKL